MYYKDQVFIFRKTSTCGFMVDVRSVKHPDIDQTAYTEAWGSEGRNHKTACTSLPEDEQLLVQNMSKQYN